MKKKTKILTTVAILIGVSSMLLFNACSSLGTRPNKEEKTQFNSSSQFNSETGQFENSADIDLSEMKKRSFTWKIIKEYLSRGKDRKPKEALPETKPQIDDFLNDSQDPKVIWFGHSSFMLNLGGIIVLVDPVFSGAASPVSFMGKRFQDPVLKLDELPKIDYIVISHDHYDHLDMESVKFFADKPAKFITPLGVGSHLKGWGISSDRIIEKDWWQTASFGNIDFICTPAQHFSGRNGIHDNETLWASWVIKSTNHKIYFSGDSGYSPHFKEIGESTDHSTSPS